MQLNMVRLEGGIVGQVDKREPRSLFDLRKGWRLFVAGWCCANFRRPKCPYGATLV